MFEGGNPSPLPRKSTGQDHAGSALCLPLQTLAIVFAVGSGFLAFCRRLLWRGIRGLLAANPDGGLLDAPLEGLSSASRASSPGVLGTTIFADMPTKLSPHQGVEHHHVCLVDLGFHLFQVLIPARTPARKKTFQGEAGVFLAQFRGDFLLGPLLRLVTADVNNTHWLAFT